jgi:N-acetylmuramoyl-L-alanine amidase
VIAVVAQAGLLALVARSALGAAVTVSVAGTKVGVADRTGEVVTGRLLPVLGALGARPSYVPGDKRLFAVAPDGTQVEARAGEAEIVVDGVRQTVGAAFQPVDGDLVGPIREVVGWLGCTAAYDAASNELRVAHRLVQVETFTTTESALVHVRLSAGAKAELQALDGPARAYVDLPGMTWTGPTETLETGGAGGLQRVRWSLFQAWPPIARVVVDLEEGAEAKVAQVSDRVFVISIRPKDRAPSPAPQALAGAHVLIDPAAGGSEAGAQGRGTTEKVVTLDVAIRLAVRLMDAGALVTLTRDGDETVPPAERSALARAVQADLALSLRCPAGQPDQRGPQVLYGSPEAAGLGEALRGGLRARLGEAGCRETDAPPVPGASCPAVTCLLGNLACIEECELLAAAEHREALAAGLAEGIAAYVAAAKPPATPENQGKATE